MKKVLMLLLAATVMVGTITVDARTKAPKEPKVKKEKAAKVSKKAEIIKDAEYRQLKEEFFNADGYGNTYNCKVEKQRFCKVKDLDTGMYVLCDRDVSRTQWESAKVFYKYGRCVKMN